VAAITFHGTGAGEPNGDRFASAASLRFNDGSNLLIDAGEACSRALVRDNVDCDSIQSVVVSHCHPDHWAGIPGLATAWYCSKRTTPVNLYVPREAVEFVRLALVHSYWFPEVMPCEIRIKPLTTLDLPDGMQLTTFPTTHLARVGRIARQHRVPETAFGFVICTPSGRVVFSQDIGSVDDLDGVISSARLLIAECAHVDPIEVLAAARHASVERVIFTHVPPVLRPFPSMDALPPWTVAFDGMSVAV